MRVNEIIDAMSRGAAQPSAGDRAVMIGLSLFLFLAGALLTVGLWPSDLVGPWFMFMGLICAPRFISLGKKARLAVDASLVALGMSYGADQQWLLGAVLALAGVLMMLRDSRAALTSSLSARRFWKPR